jgi:hypothetical protein
MYVLSPLRLLRLAIKHCLSRWHGAGRGHQAGGLPGTVTGSRSTIAMAYIYIVTEQLTLWSFNIAIGHGSY